MVLRDDVLADAEGEYTRVGGRSWSAQMGVRNTLRPYDYQLLAEGGCFLSELGVSVVQNLLFSFLAIFVPLRLNRLVLGG
jgi:hypothetical protein